MGSENWRQLILRHLKDPDAHTLFWQEIDEARKVPIEKLPLLINHAEYPHKEVYQMRLEGVL